MVKEKVFGVIGLGIFGSEVCRVLAEKGMKVIAADKDRDVLEKMKNHVSQAVLLDSTEEDALRNAGLHDIDVAVVAIGDNVNANVLTTILLKNLGVPHIIARALSALHAQVLRQIGATEVINIELEQGARLANRIVAPDVMDIIPISSNQSLAEMRAPEIFIGKSLVQLEIRKKFNVNIVSMKRADTGIDDMGNPVRSEKVFSPKPDDIIRVNDVLIILGEEKDIEKLKGL